VKAQDTIAGLAFGVHQAESTRLRCQIGTPSAPVLTHGVGIARSVGFRPQPAGSPASRDSHATAGRVTNGTSSLRARLLAALRPPPTTVGLVWPEPLYPFQQEGVAALLRQPCLLLADDMGLGKTVQAIAALRLLCREGPLRALVVVPAGLIAQWRGAFRMWAPELTLSTVRGSAADRAWKWNVPADLFLVSYETLRADAEQRVSAALRRPWDVVILDEAQKIKNADTEVSRACKRLPRARAWALTGTPLENRIEDLASICDFLQPYEAGAPRPSPPRSGLEEVHRSLQLRRRKDDVLTQLPAKSVFTIDLELTGDQRKAYDRAERDGIVRLRALGPDVRVANVLELIVRLKQICNVEPGTGQSVKMDDLLARMAVLVDQGDRALVFSQFSNDDNGAGFIARGLSEFKPLMYTGTLRADERDLVIQRFKEDTMRRVLVLSLRAGGQGLNLQEASYVVHFDRWWNPAVERQAEDRSHRMGQTRPVTVYTYRCLDTIEQRIDEVLREKQVLFDQLVDGVTLDPTGLLSKTELLGLFGITAE
jgi:SNF2 family DNA or RNA helicase